MRITLIVSVLAVGTLLVTGAIAQHEGHEGHNVPAAADKPAAAGEPMKGGMMAAHMAANELADQLVASFAAIENEKDPAALKEKLAKHGKLLRELQSKLQGQSQMMDQMRGKMTGSHKTQ